MIFLSLKEEFERKFGSQYTLRRCKQNDCALRDISRNEFFIIDGDAIKEPGEKSVDCIIVDLNSNDEDEYKVILCELTSGEKDIKDATKRFESSGKLIMNHLHELNKSIYKIDCLFLGGITRNGKPIEKKELLSNKFKIEGLDRINLIHRENCGYSIRDL